MPRATPSPSHGEGRGGAGPGAQPPPYRPIDSTAYPWNAGSTVEIA